MTFKVIDNALPTYYCEKTHKYAEMSDQWKNGGTDLIKEEVREYHSTFPIMPVMKNGETQQWHPFCGWFICVGQMLAQKAMDELGIMKFDNNLQRVHLVAHRPGERGVVAPHLDHNDEHCSIVYHLSQHNWDSSWGGDTVINKKSVSFVPNRAIVFRSNTPHYGTPPNPNCPYTRIVLNVVFRVGDSVEWRSKII